MTPSSANRSGTQGAGENILLLVSAALCAAVVLAPLARSPWLYLAFSFVCHQQPERSLWLAGLPLAVCARCAGIYLGGLVGLLLKLPSRRTPLLVAFALMTLDWASEAVGLRGASLPVRLLTGGLAGLAAAPAVLEGGTALLGLAYGRMYRVGGQP